MQGRARDLRRLGGQRLHRAPGQRHAHHPDVYLGASPRGSLALYRAGQAYAALAGRDYVIPDDIKALAEPALAHRLIIKTAATVRDVRRGVHRARAARHGPDREQCDPAATERARSVRLR
jgi:MoxR-like ATPase